MMAYCFAADRTLGKLAKWLRILGYDTVFEMDDSGKSFWENLAENRIILTRTGGIKKRFVERRLIFITSNYLNEQLLQVLAEAEIRPEDTRPFSRCIDCNIRVVEVDKENIIGLVPDYIFETHNDFHRCRRCNRIFWPGSHTKRSIERIAHLFDPVSAKDATCVNESY